MAQAQFPGDEVAAYQGLAAALDAGAEALGTPANHLPTAKDFEAFAVEQGQLAVADLQIDFLDAVISAVDAYAEIAGEAPSPHLLLALFLYAVDNGVPVAKVTREFYAVSYTHLTLPTTPYV